MINVSIIIVNYNTYDLTSQCIESIYKFTKEICFEIILVDNNSKEVDAEVFKDNFNDIILIKNNYNAGFAAGNNLGIEKAKGELILLLNSDTYLIDNSIASAYFYMKKNPIVGVNSVKLIYPDGRTQSVAQRFPSVITLLVEILRLQKILPSKWISKMLLGAFFDHCSTVKADWVWGAFFMFRKDIIKKLPQERLDDKFFMYYEDMQWCWDIKKVGYEVHYYAEAEVVHLMGGSSGAKSQLMLKNEKIFMRHNYNYFHRAAINFLKKFI